MVNESQSKGLKAWFYKRLPVKEFIETQATGYYAPKNFNIWYFFGFIAMVVLVMQLLTGIFRARPPRSTPSNSSCGRSTTGG
jgi:quinol-cytochrome oxidoreductase complex cytochrome b subunit